MFLTLSRGNGPADTSFSSSRTARAEWFVLFAFPFFETARCALNFFDIRFLNLTAVLPSGTVLKTRSRARKSSAGPDLTKLFIGAEGTLGVITEVTVRLAPLLPTRVGMCGFPGVKQAVEAVVEILGEGVVVQCGEFDSRSSFS